MRGVQQTGREGQTSASMCVCEKEGEATRVSAGHRQSHGPRRRSTLAMVTSQGSAANGQSKEAMARRGISRSRGLAHIDSG